MHKADKCNGQGSFWSDQYSKGFHGMGPENQKWGLLVRRLDRRPCATFWEVLVEWRRAGVPGSREYSRT